MRSNVSVRRRLGAFAGAVGLAVIMVGAAQSAGEAAPTWSAMTLPVHSAGAYLRAASCPTVKFCMALGQVSYKLGTTTFVQPYAEKWNGLTWSGSTQLNQGGRESIPPVASSVSCASASFCLAVGNNYTTQTGFAEKWNGFGWSKVTAPPATAGFDGVSCVSSAYCVVLGDTSSGQSASEIWNGKAWSVQLLPSATFYPNDISCVSTSFCMAAGGASPVTDAWNGESWSAVPAPVPFASISCVSSTSCEAAGVVDQLDGSVSFAGWNGTAWQAQAAPPNLAWNAYFRTSCASPTFCVAFGANVNQTTGALTLRSAAWNGVSWSDNSPASPGTPSAFFGGGCPSVSLCLAVGSAPTGEIAYKYAG